MAYHHYIKFGFGTNTGASPFTVAQTGTFASLGAANCYDSLLSLDAAVGIAIGDIIYLSDLHNKIYATVTAYNISGGDGFVQLYSVDDANCDQYKAGAHEEVTSGNLTVNSTNLRDHYSIYGVSFKAVSGDLYIQGYHSIIEMVDCALFASGIIRADKASLRKLTSCTTTCTQLYGANDVWKIKNCIMNHTYALIRAGSGSVSLDGCDLSGSTNGIFLIADDGTLSAVNLKLIHCALPSNFAYRKSATYNYIDLIEIVGCDNVYNQGMHDKYFEISNDTANYLTATYNGTDGVSTLASTLTEVGNHHVARFKLVEFADQDLTTDTTYKVNFESDFQLTDTEYWISLIRPDGTNQALGVEQSSRNADVLATGTEHNTNTEAWNVVKTYRYDDSLTITGMVGIENANVEVWINIAIPNTDIWIDPAVVIS